MAPWSSTDMRRKYSVDKATQVQKANELHALQAASSQTESWLSENQTILDIDADQLRKAKPANARLEKEIQDTEDELQRDQGDLVEKKNALEECIKKAKKDKKSLLRAEAALAEAQRQVSERHAANISASADEKRAHDRLIWTITHRPDQVLAARQDVVRTQEVRANASEALAEAEREEVARGNATELAGAAARTAEAQQARDTEAYKGAVGAVERQRSHLNELKKEKNKLAIGLLESAVERQGGVVKVLEKNSQKLHEEVDAMEKAYDEINAVVDKDYACISRLQTYEGNLDITNIQFEKIARAYEAEPADVKKQLKAALWIAWEQNVSSASALYDVWDDCAPGTVELGPRPALQVCSNDTGGTCGWWGWCHDWRHGSFCSAGQCLCPAGTCAAFGVCKDRGLPVLPAGPSAELGVEAAGVRRLPSSSRAGWPSCATSSAGAGAVCLAAATLMTAIRVLRRRRRAYEIRLPEVPFGVL